MNNTANGLTADGWQALAFAIVKQACDDWRYNMKLRRSCWTDSKKAMQTVRECEAFMRSGSVEFLTDINGQYLLRKLRDEEKEVKAS